MESTKIGTAICVHDDASFLPHCIKSFAPAGPVHVFVSKVPWHGPAGNWNLAVDEAKKAGASVIVGEWPVEILQRQGAVQWMLDHGFTHALMPDSDEIIEARLREALCAAASVRLAQRMYVEMDTYWKSPDIIIRPRESLRPLMLMELAEVWPDDAHKFSGRIYGGGTGLVFRADHGLLHHLSYVGSDERIARKLGSWSHHDEVVPDWWNRIWLAWDENPMLRNLHPTHPAAYGFTERITRPAELAEIDDPRTSKEALEVSTCWPTVSVIIPLYGNPIELRRCLMSLERCGDLISEVIVIDNASPDRAAAVAQEFEFVHLIRNSTNLGFGVACNQGAETAVGDVLLFLNSDTILPRAGLQRLIESLMQSGSVGAAGPLTNRSAHFQQIEVNYTDLANIDLFAMDFARRAVPDREIDMLVGFCLAVRKAVFDEVGPFDPRFGMGLFEDNDLCYRIRRAGYKLVLSTRSFVHHEGSKSLWKLPDPAGLLRRNHGLYERKWQADLDTGFASTLSGQNAEPIRFDPNRKPERLREAASDRAKRAKISLCMIVRDEERVLGDCLESAKPYFSEIIVVDTGSTDSTKAIAARFGATVIDHPWCDSFSDARNVSLQHASGNWICWLDADDTLPINTGEAILRTALSAGKDIIGALIPVQFVDGGPVGGTRVDHVKLFRNLPGLTFEFRIHEQILGSLKKHPGGLVRITEPVLHSGYDTSPEGQAKKKLRDEKLLALDLADRPGNPFILFNHGMTYHNLGEYEIAIDWFKKCLAASAEGESHKRKAYALLASSQGALGRAEEACNTIVKGIQEVNDDPELRFQYGMMLSELGRHQEALEQYLAMRAPDPNVFSSFDIGILTFKRDHNLGSVYYELGDYNKAVQLWRQAIAASPAFVHSAICLFDAALKEGDYDASREMLQHVQRLSGCDVHWAEMIAKFEERWHGPESMFKQLTSVVDQRPYEIGPRLVLSRKMLAADLLAEVQPHLKILASGGVAEAAFFLGISETRAGRFPEALAWMERAQTLNPKHEQTKVQIEHLRKVLRPVATPVNE